MNDLSIRGVADERLLRMYESETPESPDAGLAYNEIYRRYREPVRDAMIATGLRLQDAEGLVGVVFVVVLDALKTQPLPPTADAFPLREHLLSTAASVARDPRWLP